jgi:putative transposase
MRVAIVAKHRGIWPVAWLCEALDVLRLGFHAWLNRGPSRRAREDEAIGAELRASFLASGRTYGARRVWRDVFAGRRLRPASDREAVRVQALRARPRRRGLPLGEGLQAKGAAAPNVLDRRFAAERANIKWIAYFAYIWTAEGCP